MSAMLPPNWRSNTDSLRRGKYIVMMEVTAVCHRSMLQEMQAGGIARLSSGSIVAMCHDGLSTPS
ncbi:hypothetical protein IG631_10375 [Alternaria alternata]|nr:hypothetical protein IG631_10375 [Alternaria alternata]